jgi:hypothetical protein
MVTGFSNRSRIVSRVASSSAESSRLRPIDDGVDGIVFPDFAKPFPDPSQQYPNPQIAKTKIGINDRCGIISKTRFHQKR